MRSRRDVWIALLLFAVTVALYWRTTDFPFISYDDHRYVTQNQHVLRGLTPDNIAWAFTTFYFANWHPLTWISHMLDVSVHDGWAGGHHFTNFMLHASNAGLLMLLLAGLTGSTWRSALVAGLFAIHPLHVESVAWIAERKDVLSTFFGLLAMHAHGRYARCCTQREPTRSRSACVVNYSIVLTCFALSLMCKPMLVTLPCVLLLLDWWPLKRLNTAGDWPRLIAEKIPLFVLSVASSVVTVLAQHAGGAMRDFDQVSLTQRLGNAVAAYGTYLWQTIWPVGLAVFYPYPLSLPFWRIAYSGLAMVAITVLCVVAWRRGSRAPLVGWLWFFGTLAPVIGLVQVGAQAHADRYMYIPSIGLFIMLAWSLPVMTRAGRIAAAVLVTALLIVLGATCWRQIGYWRSDSALALHTLDVTTNNRVGHEILASALMDQGDYPGAIAHLETATRIDPAWGDAWVNLGNAYTHAGRLADAVTAYQQAIARRPDLAEPPYNLGVALRELNRPAEAREALEAAIRIDPDFAEAHIHLGSLLRDLNQLPESLAEFQKAVALRPNDPVGLINLADALMRVNRLPEARAILQRAVDAATAAGDVALHDQAVNLMRQLPEQH